jgi:hypothetical protein
MGESQHPDPGSGMNNPDHILKSLETIFFAFLGVKILKFFDEDPGSEIRDGDSSDPGSGIRDGKKLDPGSGINIPDPQHCMDTGGRGTKRCRLSWLTNCALLYEPKCGERGGYLLGYLVCSPPWSR